VLALVRQSTAARRLRYGAAHGRNVIADPDTDELNRLAPSQWMTETVSDMGEAS
jgi:hypothetical protein